MRTVTVETVVDPIVMFDGEAVYATQRTYTKVSDIRNTPFGDIDFGHVHVGPVRPATGEKFSFDVDVSPPWWSFWRKPKTERKEFTVTASFGGWR